MKKITFEEIDQGDHILRRKLQFGVTYDYTGIADNKVFQPLTGLTYWVTKEDNILVSNSGANRQEIYLMEAGE